MTDPMDEIDDATRQRIEAFAFRRLLAHLRHRTDVQNVDLMALGGFCRNCLADWVAQGAADAGVAMDKAGARRAVYGMAYDAWKERHQTPASDAQLAAMEAGVARNAGRGF
ncbi:alkaline phosphatase [Rhodothalassium salexigens]|uniref:DUF1244 domain-containing protein n=1 Tax=Rhodothalassium salexigens TaxID=1086 RepID=UPI001F5DDA50|nr:DUF1244 domain-containing protein [Rhodothalassium salexigens]MBK5909952.1 alkaline phosphatase [Rhodothalassium salexigens]MBK5919552.1 alkaline phosphatase [Rhodothalassium salexigens]